MTDATQSAITIWFDFGSPYAWLASAQVEAVAARCGRPLAWKAILLGVVFRETGMLPLVEQRLRGDYARRLGLAFTTATPRAGTSMSLARVFHAIARSDAKRAARFACEALAAVFAHGEALDDLESAQAFAARLGRDAGDAACDALSPSARKALRAATAEALALGGGRRAVLRRGR